MVSAIEPYDAVFLIVFHTLTRMSMIWLNSKLQLSSCMVNFYCWITFSKKGFINVKIARLIEMKYNWFLFIHRLIIKSNFLVKNLETNFSSIYVFKWWKFFGFLMHQIWLKFKTEIRPFTFLVSTDVLQLWNLIIRPGFGWTSVSSSFE